MDPAFIVLTGIGVAIAVALSVVVGTLTARLFFRASGGDAEVPETKHEAVR